MVISSHPTIISHLTQNQSWSAFFIFFHLRNIDWEPTRCHPLRQVQENLLENKADMTPPAPHFMELRI